MLFEMSNEVYKLMITMHEATRSYDALAACHLSLHRSYLDIIACVRAPLMPTITALTRKQPAPMASRR